MKEKYIIKKGVDIKILRDFWNSACITVLIIFVEWYHTILFTIYGLQFA